jgi:hypothetical protein
MLAATPPVLLQPELLSEGSHRAEGEDEKNWKATMNANKDQLKAAPEYKYESEWRKR